MGLLGAFSEFSKRVVDTSKKGGLSPKDTKKLQNLLNRTAKRNTILAKGILSALSAGGATSKDVSRLSQLLHMAEDRIANEQQPFTQIEQKEITSLFQKAFMSAKTARWFSSQIDELVAQEIQEFLSGSRGVEAAIPSRKSIRLPEKRVDLDEDQVPKRKMRI
ncbi:MAG: hypothetical protein ACP5N9_01960 [Candidatus Bilamarchaeum sp.]|jgi:3-oxoacyl-ACP reductase-like protein